ncbi:MAG: CHAT domain-containing protein [Myxococcales bacterium]|nr:CHAT domain-containing protein [Myxococcales bacterium]
MLLTYLHHGDLLHVLGSADGTVAALRPVGSFEPDWASIRAADARIRGLIGHAADAGELGSAATEDLIGACGLLYDELVPLPAKRWLRAGAASTLTLSLPTSLLDLPWEILHTGDDFLCLVVAMGRVVQLEEVPPRRRSTAAARVLVVSDPDGGLDGAYDEGMVLRSRLPELCGAAVTFRSGDVDASYVRRRARDADVLHFAGHIDAAGWRMSDGAFSADDVARLSDSAPLPRLVYANGCRGGSEGPGSTSGPLVLAWLRGGVEHHLGPLFDVPDPLARQYALAFYGALASGAAIGEAVRLARLEVAARSGIGATPWAAFVLYGDPGATYFPARATDGRDRAARERAGGSRDVRVAIAPTVARSAPPSLPPTRLEHAPVRGADAPARPAKRAPGAGDLLFVALVLLAALVGAAAGFSALRGG